MEPVQGARRGSPRPLLCQWPSSRDAGGRSAADGAVGLAKFRDTRAEFKNFQVAEKIVEPQLSAAAAGRIEKLLSEGTPPKALPTELIEQLTPESPDERRGAFEKAQQMEQQAERLRRLAAAVRQSQVKAELSRLIAEPDERVDLWTAALWLARLDNDEVDIEAYRQQLDRMATEISASLEKDAPEAARIAGLDKFFFKESGFHGSRRDYGNRSNSYVNEVLDDREGLPITLSLIYMELGKRLGLRIEGVGLPGHFVVRYRPAEGDARLDRRLRRRSSDHSRRSRAARPRVDRCAADRSPNGSHAQTRDSGADAAQFIQRGAKRERRRRHAPLS